MLHAVGVKWAHLMTPLSPVRGKGVYCQPWSASAVKEEAHSTGPAQAHAQIPPSRKIHVIMEKQHGQTMSSSDLETSGKRARKRAPAGKNPPAPLVEPSVAMDTTCAGVRE